MSMLTTGCGARKIGGGDRHRRSRPCEERKHVIRPKARTRSDHAAMAEAMLLGSEEPQRLDQVEVFLCTGSSRRRGDGALPRAAPACRWPCPKGCSHRQG